MYIIAVLVCVMFLILMMEFFLGFVYYNLKRGKSWYKIISKGVFKYDSLAGYSYTSNNIIQDPTVPMSTAPRRILFKDHRTEKNGFLFTGEIEEISKVKKLIFCIGGSTTAGAECFHDQTYPAMLDKLVKKQGYRVINAGVGGYRSIHELIMFKNKILPIKPYMVIIFSGYNDFEDVAYFDEQINDPFIHCLSSSIPRTRLVWFLNYSAVFHVARGLFFILMNKVRKETANKGNIEKLQQIIQNPEWLNVWENNIGEIIDLCKENNIKCCLIDHLSPVYSDAPQKAKYFADKDINMSGRFDIFVKYIELINKEAALFCEAKGAIYLDLKTGFEEYCSKFEGDDYYINRFKLFTDRMHFTEEGNKILADAIYAKINKML
jgi:lysophospholipase L1-like esterase